MIQNVAAFTVTDNLTPQNLHFHEAIEIATVTKGTGLLQVGQKRFEAGNQKVSIVMPNELHGGTPTHDAFQVRGIQIGIDWFREVDLDWNLLTRVSSVEESGKIFQPFLKAHESISSRSLDVDINDTILSLLDSVVNEPVGSVKHSSGARREVIELAIEFLRSNLHRKVEIQEIARVTGFSPSQITRLFKEEFSLGPFSYHLRMRVARADRLARNGHPLNWIATETGFYDSSHLLRNLKKYRG